MTLSLISCATEAVGQVVGQTADSLVLIHASAIPKAADGVSSLIKWITVLAPVVVALITGWFSHSIAEWFRRKNVVRKYGAFLRYSAWTLQDRINSILHKDFPGYYTEDDDKKMELNKRERKNKSELELDVYAINAVSYTVFLFCQFFAWCEIINRGIFNLKLKKCGSDSKILKKIIDIEHWFSTDSTCLNPNNSEDFDKKSFMIFRGEQRALGDACIDFNEHANAYECIGFSDFIKKRDSSEGFICQISVDKLEDDVRKFLNDNRNKPDEERKKINKDRYTRLLIIRNLLIDLYQELNKTKIRHAKDLEHESVSITCHESCQREKTFCNPPK